jgi:hypothetical protein
MDDIPPIPPDESEPEVETPKEPPRIIVTVYSESHIQLEVANDLNPILVMGIGEYIKREASRVMAMQEQAIMREAQETARMRQKLGKLD